MLVASRIERLVAAGEFERLVDEVLRNGRPATLAARLRLTSSEAVEPAALGLGLARLVEVNYRPGSAECALARGLVDRQREDGAWGGDGARGSIVGTAAAVKGLLALLRLVDPLGVGRAVVRSVDEGLVGQMRCAVERGLGWLASRGEAWPWLGIGEESEEGAVSEGDGGRGLLGDSMESAVVLWLLSDEPWARGVLRLEELSEAAEREGLGRDARTAPLLETAAARACGAAAASVAARRRVA
ncbi:MAG: hypothetical protein IBJ11_12345 [Phycisphaerales bacterium]|nr:hypothetical protein [Phycisphaerales bacterium]